LNFILNGETVDVVSDADAPLLFVLRNELGQRGTRFGCGMEQCGACMVLIDGEAVFSCTRPIATVAGRSVTTIEGLAREGAVHPLVTAFVEEQAGQCGYCLSGILITAAALLRRNPAPSEAEIRSALDRNLCRCGIHNRIVRAVQKASAAAADSSP
jgi:aerobic-type carbon monoxide dehydrogenase small subunit (CoxS/CutS family)